MSAEQEAKRIADLWLPYPEHTPLNGWCATTDGGDIALSFWSSDGCWIDDRDVTEFFQVTVNETPTR